MTQAQLANLLGMRDYMNTSLKTGTSPAELMEGVAKFLKDRGFLYGSLKYQGWRPHAKAFFTGVLAPHIDWIKKGLIGNSAVWLNVGFYKEDKEKDTYLRRNGHWGHSGGIWTGSIR